MQIRHFLVGSILVVVLVALPASAQVRVEGLRVGFGGSSDEKDSSYKIGNWTPAVVKLRADGVFEGSVEISTSDSDDVQATFERPIRIGPDGVAELRTYVKPGKLQPAFQVRVHDASGRTLDSETFESASGHVSGGVPQRVTLIATVGRPAGLDAEAIAKRPGYLRDDYRVAHAASARELPDRWFGFDAVDHLVICASDLEELKWLDETQWAVRELKPPLNPPADGGRVLPPSAGGLRGGFSSFPALTGGAGRGADGTTRHETERQAAHERWTALETWVGQGGHLVLSVGTEWDAAASLFGPMLPADSDRIETLRQLPELENYVGQNAPAIQLSSPLAVPHLTPARGRTLAGVRDLPLIVRGPYGLGTVTLVALDVNRDPFQSWDGRTDFWIKLLRLAKQRTSDGADRGAWGQRAASDLSSHLHVDLERFTGVSLVPFHWVAAFVFIYVLLVGPADYWLVRRLNRMELTWVTFPLIVVAACLAAYFTVRALKGDSLAVNKLDVIDVDAASGTMRGTSWFTLYSPELKNYSVAVRPDSRFTAEPDSPAVTPIVVSWMGVAEDSIGGIGRKGGVGLFLFRRGYRFSPDAQSLSDVPVAVSSTKAFMARWLGKSPPTMQADLRTAGTDRLRGPLTNRTGAALQDCVLAFGGRAYPLGNLPAGGSVLVESSTTEDLRGLVARRAEQYEKLRAGNTGGDDGPGSPDKTASYDLLVTMMFRSRLGDDNKIAPNEFFGEIDLSEQLDHQRAIFIARTAAGGSQLTLGGSPATQNVSSLTALRIILPVAASPPALEQRRDPRSF